MSEYIVRIDDDAPDDFARAVSTEIVQELVRCKDCKYNYANMIPDGKGCQRNVYIEADDNFFCADGERENEE